MMPAEDATPRAPCCVWRRQNKILITLIKFKAEKVFEKDLQFVAARKSKASSDRRGNVQAISKESSFYC